MMASKSLRRNTERDFFARVPGGVANAGVRRERAAAELATGDDDFAAVGGERTRIVASLSCEKSDVGDASGEEGHAGSARTDGGKRPRRGGGRKKIVVDAREETFALGETEKFQDADAARDGLHAGALIET